MRRWLLGGLVGAVALFGATCAACRFLLPERFAVNAPLTNSLFGWGTEPPAPSVFGTRIRVPEGFSIGLYAAVPRARFLRATPAGDLLVSVPREGRVVLLARDADGDGLPDGQRTLLEGLDRPHGLDLHDGWLYVAETSSVLRFPFDAARGAVTGEPERIVEGLPSGGNHWTRTVRIGPDGWMYVTVGSSCNACVEEDPRRAAMLRFRPDGSEGDVFATGLRNAVGFDWRPATGALYATDNGRDLLGDDFPPCELNRVVAGGDYGWPVANGDRVPDPDLGAGHEARIAASIPPVHGFAAHNAPLGIHFLEHPSLPEAWRGVALVALHGSWNRTRKDGYKVVSLHFEEGGVRESDFVWGFLEGDDVIGRPVDVTEGPEGSIFVSDDYAGAVYRVAWGREVAERAPAPSPREGTSGRAATGAAAPTTEDALRRGAALWARHGCAGCHLAEETDPEVVPVPLVGLPERHDPAGLAAFLAAPTPPMPAFPLAPDERRDLALYLLSRFD